MKRVKRKKKGVNLHFHLRQFFFLSSPFLFFTILFYSMQLASLSFILFSYQIFVFLLFFCFPTKFFSNYLFFHFLSLKNMATKKFQSCYVLGKHLRKILCQRKQLKGFIEWLKVCFWNCRSQMTAMKNKLCGWFHWIPINSYQLALIDRTICVKASLVLRW